MFDLEDILKIGMNRLADKVNYFNNYYMYRTGIGTGESSIDINIDAREYADVINDIYNSIVDIIDSILISLEASDI